MKQLELFELTEYEKSMSEIDVEKIRASTKSLMKDLDTHYVSMVRLMDQITGDKVQMIPKDDLIFRLKERARIRRQIPTRKSVQEGAADRIADLLEEAADALYNLQEELETMKGQSNG
jgi:hypothetical protein